MTSCYFMGHQFQIMRSFAMVCDDFAQKKESRMANFATEWYKQTGNTSIMMYEKRPTLLGD